ncbi:MAG TPA: efflux RND transporter permease subunit, partial [Phenylobacterium sp.]
MRFTDIFIQRPVLATVISLLILLLGLRSLQLLNVREFPKTTNAIVTVSTTYTGASAELVQGFITTKLETQIATADGIDYLESSSVQGASTITAHLRLNYDPNDALTQITSKVNQVVNQLPPEAEQPTINVAVGETTASMYIAFYSDVMQPNQITDYLLRVVQPKLATVPGVQQAEILGARTFAMRIWLQPDKMAALGIAPAEVRSVLAQNNYLAAVGNTKGTMISVPLQASTDIHTAEQFRQLVVKRQAGATIRLQDIATVDLGAENYDVSVRFNGQQATFIGINVLPTANPLTVIRQIRTVFPDLEAQFPPGLKAIIPYDVTQYITLSIKEVIRTLVEALLIVMAVIFLFLGSVRTVLIPVVAIPLSIVGAAFLMLVLGFSINLLTLLAMVLAIGLVVDDAIVVVENIERHIEEGRSPFEAALVGARELGAPVIAMTITLAAVYAPIGFMGGLTGTLFTEFAFTLAGAVIVSGIVALTLSPMMCSRILRPHAKKTGFVHFLDVSFDRLRRVYRAILHTSLNFRPVILTLAALILAGCYFLFNMAQSELAPNEDQGFLAIQTTGPPNASIDYMDRYGAEIGRMALTLAEVPRTFLILGSSGGPQSTTNSGFIGLNLSDWDKRRRTAMDLLPVIQGMIGQVSGLRSVAFSLPPLPAGGQGLPIQFVVGSTNTPLATYELAGQLVQRAMGSGLFAFADIDLKYDLPQVLIEVDRDKAADLGLNMQ